MSYTMNSLDRDINDWMASRFPGAKPKLIVKHPWARTWRFDADGQTCYLKHISRGGPEKTLAALKISNAFNDVVPRVIDANPKLALLAVQDHGGKELKSRTENMAKVLPTYAKLQVKAIATKFESGSIPEVRAESITDDLLMFLASKNTKGSIGAAYFMGAKNARQFHTLFTHISSFLRTHLENAESLPKTINHCDLRPPNMAKRSDGTISIFDWDDACWGPVGLSLHAQFSGCLRPYNALNADMATQQSSTIKRDRKHLDAYIDVFVRNGIISAVKMREKLSAAIVAGTINYIVSFKNYAVEKGSIRRTIGKNITKRLNSILDVMERLARLEAHHAKMMAKGYFLSAQWNRLEALQKWHNAPLIDLPNLNDRSLELARVPGVFPQISFSDMERDAGVCTPENARLAASIYREQGVILLKNSLNASVINDCREHIFESYDDYFQNKRPKDSLRVGNKRFMITLTLEGPLNQPALYAPPTIIPILEQLLSNKMILGSMVAVTSLPGAANQSRHRDHRALFPGEDVFPPPFATSVMIPLIDMNEEVGATRLFKGSHLQPTDIANTMPGQDPVVPVGSCFLMDYRVQHMGMANKSKDKVRPVITLIFQRPWFRDYVNYDNQERIILPDNERLKISEEHEKLFDWK